MARHFSNLNIETFRGINNLELNNLSNVNILVGANNCGKTSVLEAAMVLSRPNDFSNILRISRLREGAGANLSPSLYDSFLFLFNKLSDNMLVSVSCEEASGNKTLVRLYGKIQMILLESISEGMDSFVGELFCEGGHEQIRFFPNVIPVSFNKYDNKITLEKNKPYIKMKYISTIDHIVKNNFNEIVRNRHLSEKVIEILKLFDSNIKDLRIVQDKDGRIVQMVDNSLSEYMPLSTYGDGIKKVIALANGVAEAENGILLVDEIETSIHANALKQVFNWLINACKTFNVQLFLTTHSIETVDAMLNCNTGFISDDLIRVITLSKKENQTIARILTGEKALQVRDDYDLELRK